MKHGWRRSVSGGHVHLLVLHRHPTWECHPRSAQTHLHLWVWHRHAIDELMNRWPS